MATKKDNGAEQNFRHVAAAQTSFSRSGSTLEGDEPTKEFMRANAEIGIPIALEELRHARMKPFGRRYWEAR